MPAACSGTSICRGRWVRHPGSVVVPKHIETVFPIHFSGDLLPIYFGSISILYRFVLFPDQPFNLTGCFLLGQTACSLDRMFVLDVGLLLLDLGSPPCQQSGTVPPTNSWPSCDHLSIPVLLLGGTHMIECIPV